MEDFLGVCGREARNDYVAAAVCFVCHGLISFFFDRGQCKQSILTLSFDCEVKLGKGQGRERRLKSQQLAHIPRSRYDPRHLSAHD